MPSEYTDSTKKINNFRTIIVYKIFFFRKREFYPAKQRFIPPFKPPNTNLSRQKLACLGEKCWNLQNYLDKSVVGIHFY